MTIPWFDGNGGGCSTGSENEFAAGIPGGEGSADSQGLERLQLQLYLPIPALQSSGSLALAELCASESPE